MENTVKKSIALVMIAGMLSKVETVTYPSTGEVVVRTYSKPNDVIPADIQWVKTSKPLSPDQIIEHRECELLNYWHK